MTPPRLLVVNCNISESITSVIDAAARAAAGPDAEVATIAPSWGVASAEGYLDGQLASVAMLDAVRRYDRPYDAVVLAGFGEPGREAFRELLEVPVVDITDAAVHVALMLAPRFGVVTSLPRAIVQIQDSLHSAGVAANCVGVRAADLPVLKVGTLEIGPESPLVVQSRTLLEQGAEALVLGCAGLAGLDKEVSAHLGVPVIDPVAAGVAMAEALVRLGHRTSKLRTYAAPRAKARPGWDAGSERVLAGL
ncbi:aspartate/glutamate racemase family protein [Amycolatopsis orientalis]|uniref:aspartate/glutamate racemase family protein n=1 Tax=Amycolatopsis orientalis TaxID=31958 RepID=UPI00039F3807|nr:aspartate/glutamate racemase family protein [Amycolatopsis orientalis]